MEIVDAPKSGMRGDLAGDDSVRGIKILKTSKLLGRFHPRLLGRLKISLWRQRRHLSCIEIYCSITAE